MNGVRRRPQPAKLRGVHAGLAGGNPQCRVGFSRDLRLPFALMGAQDPDCPGAPVPPEICHWPEKRAVIRIVSGKPPPQARIPGNEREENTEDREATRKAASEIE